MNLAQAKERLIFECISGSRAYGTATPESDTDLRGVFLLPAAHYLQLHDVVNQVSDEMNDITYYTLKRFFELAADANPNILELLFVPDDCIQKMSKEWEKVKANRNLFISKRVLYTYSGYAVAQIKKAKGQNKLVNNPMPEQKPTKEDYCWVVPLVTIAITLDSYPSINRRVKQRRSISLGKMPFRPSLLKECGISLSEYHCSAVEHVKDMYRLYYYGDESKGVFRGDDSADIVCESIPMEDEDSHFYGVLLYHRDAYERDLKNWHNYWDWKKNRNEARWRDQENKTVSYDSKNICHCMRLLYEAEHILEHGYPKVRFEGEQLQRLKDIRFAYLPYEEIMAEAEERLAKLDAAKENCSLPHSPNREKLSELLIEMSFNS
jgi:predicted nucleotidyltransferase